MNANTSLFKNLQWQNLHRNRKFLCVEYKYIKEIIEKNKTEKAPDNHCALHSK